MEMPRWALPVAAIATSGLLSGVLLTACGSESGTKQNVAAGATQGVQPAEEPSEAPSGGTGLTIETATDGKLGKIVVDAAGNTLYRFDNDTAKPSATKCVGDCAKTWPPVTTEDKVAVRGLNASLVGKVRRPDGTWQVTLGGWPLYKYAKDTSPGDTLGQGVGGLWYATTPTGRKAGGQQAAAPTPSPSRSPRWSGLTLTAKDDPKFGKVVVDARGNVLYRFERDKPGIQTGVSNCYGSCAKLWPVTTSPLNVNKIKLVGIDRRLVGNIERKDGTCQVTLGGWPLYRYAKDTSPGEINGQGVGGVWFVVNTLGKKAQAVNGGNNDYSGGGY